VSWSRCQYKKELKPVRHARVPLCMMRCVDCQRELRVTHLVARFGQRCRSCWQALLDGVEAEVTGRAEG
jgi:hypothetical protein